MTKKILIPILVSLLGAAAAASWLIATESGLRFVLRQLPGLLPVEFQVYEASGRLAGPLLLEGVRVETDTLGLEIDSLEFDWNMGALLAARIDAEQLIVNGVEIEQLASGDEPLRLPENMYLPVTVDLERFELRDLNWYGVEASEPFRIEWANFGMTLNSELFSLEDIDFNAQGLTLGGGLSVRPSQPYTVSSELAWQVDLPDIENPSGSMQLSGDLDQLGIRLTMPAPWGLTGLAELDEVLTFGRLTAQADIAGLDSTDIIEGAPPLVIDAGMSLDIENSEAAFTGEADVALPNGLIPNIVISGSYTGNRITLNVLQFSLPESGGRVDAEGFVDLSGTPVTGQITGAWQQLAWPLNGETLVASPDGRFDISGSADEYELSADLLIGADDIPVFPISLRGRGNTGELELSEVSSTSLLGGSLNGALSARWDVDPIVRFAFTAAGLDPGQLDDELTGEIAIEGNLEVSAAPDAPVSLSLETTASGVLMDQEVSVDGRVAAVGEEYTVDNLQFISGGSTLTASGTIGQALQFEWNLRSPDLADLVPGAGGSLDSTGRISGSRSAPVVAGSIVGSGLAWRDFRLGSLRAEADVDLMGVQVSTLDIEMADGLAGDVHVDRVSIVLNGTAADHQLILDGQTSHAELSAQLTGALAELDTELPEWRFNVRSLDITPGPALGNGRLWRQSGPAQGQVSAGAWQLSELCLFGSESGRICADGYKSSDGVEISASLEDFPLAYLAELYLPDLITTGRLDGSAYISGTDLENATVAMKIAISDTEFRSIDRNGNQFRILALNPTELSIAGDADGIRSEVRLNAPNVGTLAASVELGPAAESFADRTLSGNIDLDIPDVTPFIAFLPQIERLGGNISGSVSLSGSMSEPVAAGQVELLNGLVEMSELGLELNNIYFLAETDDGVVYDIDGEMSSCAGGISIKGSFNLGESDTASILRVMGEDFEFCNSATFQLTVSPDIEIRTQGRNMSITGDVAVPQADVRPAGGTRTGAVTPSADQMIIDPDSDQQDVPLLINSEVTVSLGDEVQFTGFGLSTRLTGALGIIDPPGRPTLARGELQLVDGTFQGYGQSLEIEEGRLLFAGGLLTQPGISLRAVRRPNRNVLVGIEVTGSLASPRLEMFSDPGMNSAEQLAWLTTGRPLSDLSRTESSSLTTTALALSLAGDRPIANRVGNRLGLDQFGLAATGGGFEGDSGDQTALMLGKYLSPRLFISYAIGVFEPVNVLRAEYSLNDRWKLVTETDGIHTRGDIIYEVEKGSVEGPDEE